MSMINCPDCGKEISDSAKSCPNCGYSIMKKQRRKKLSIRKNVIFDAIANSVLGGLFIAFLFADGFFEYCGVTRVNGKYDYDFIVSGFEYLIDNGTDFKAEVIIGFMTVIVVLILFFCWFKCYKPNLQNKKAYNFINMLLAIVLGAVFLVFVFIAKEGISETIYYDSRLFISFLFVFYIELIVIVLLIALAVFNYVKININSKKKNNEFDVQTEQIPISEQTNISENSI